MDYLVEQPQTVLLELPDAKQLNRALVQKKCRQCITRYYGGRKADKELTPNFYMTSFIGKVNYYLRLKYKNEIGEAAFYEMLRIIGSEDEEVYEQILKRLKNPNARDAFRQIPSIPPMQDSFIFRMGEQGNQNNRNRHREPNYYSGKQNNTLMIVYVCDYNSLYKMFTHLMVSFLIFMILNFFS